MLTRDDMHRYDRQIRLPEIGEIGQKKLSRKSILIVGLGGLGSISAYYLAAAGVGHLRIVDRDRVAMDNLNRQIIHCTHDIERPKVDSAREKLKRLNPDCRIEPVFTDFSDINGSDLAAGTDLIVDATDNISARRILNRASISHRIPYIYGGINGFDGMVSTFVPGDTPCFECLFPQNMFSEGRVGVVGPTAALVASIQVLETIKIIIGTGRLLKNELLYIQGANMACRKISIERNPACQACSPSG